MNSLKVLLLAMLFGISVSSHGEVVLETDDSLATFTGTWTKATATPGYYGTNYSTAPVSTTAQTARFFSPKPITTTGSWCVQARWIAGTNRSATATYQLYDATTLRSTVAVDQRINGGAWRTLGCIALTAGKTAEARLLNSSGTTGTLVVADAVRWVWEESSAQNLCINVAGGQGAGGGTYIGRGMSYPAAGSCKPWTGFMKTGTTVVGFSTGSGCTSTDGKVYTATLETTNPSFFGPGTIVSDHIQLCTGGAAACPSGVTQTASSSYFGGSAPALVTCTATMLTLPSKHD